MFHSEARRPASCTAEHSVSLGTVHGWWLVRGSQPVKTWRVTLRPASPAPWRMIITNDHIGRRCWVSRRQERGNVEGLANNTTQRVRQPTASVDAVMCGHVALFRVGSHRLWRPRGHTLRPAAYRGQDSDGCLRLWRTDRMPSEPHCCGWMPLNDAGCETE